MKLRGRWIVMLAALLPASAVTAQQQANPLGERVMQGVRVGQRLWLRNEKGVVAVEGNDGRWVAQAHDVLALERRGQALWLLSQRPASAQDLTITVLDQGRSNEVRLALASGEKAIALLPADRPMVLSDKAIYRRVGSLWRRTPISDSEPPSPFRFGVPATAMSSDGRYLYLGYNRGEWGGELARLDLTTGRKKRVIDGNITALIPDPPHAGCVIASKGVVHMMMASGSVERVCRSGSDPLYSRALAKEESEFPNNKEPIWALAPDAKGGFWAVGFSLHHFLSDGQREERPEPGLFRPTGVMISRVIPGVTLVLTDSNRRFQVSGNTPLIVPD